MQLDNSPSPARRFENQFDKNVSEFSHKNPGKITERRKEVHTSPSKEKLDTNLK